MAASFTKLLQNLQRKISCGDCDNLGNIELKKLTDLNLNIVVNTQTTLLLRKTQRDKTDYFTQLDKQ